MKKIILIFFFFASQLRAQDALSSQFYQHPLSVNPALTGGMAQSDRLSLSYRNQWGSLLGADAFQTYCVSYDHKITVGRRDFMGVGVHAFSDKGGALAVQQNQIGASFAYAREIGGNRRQHHFLTVGTQWSVGQRRLDLAAATWGTQQTNGRFNAQQATNENTILNTFDNRMYADAAVGVALYSVFDRLGSLYVGGAAQHLNTPMLSETANAAQFLKPRFVFHAGGEYLFANATWAIVPQWMSQWQGKNFETNVGTALQFRFRRDGSTALQCGVWNRFGNSESQYLNWQSLVLATKLSFANGSVGVSYDFNTNALAATNRNGGVEINLAYLFGKANRNGVYCPTF